MVGLLRILLCDPRSWVDRMAAVQMTNDVSGMMLGVLAAELAVVP